MFEQHNNVKMKMLKMYWFLQYNRACAFLYYVHILIKIDERLLENKC